MTAAGSRTDVAGVTLVELLVTMAVTLVLGGAVVGLVQVFRVVATSQPEVADAQQRLRTALQMIGDDLAHAGAGLDTSALAGPLSVALPGVAPYRRGQVDDDASSGVFFRPDVVSLVHSAGARAQAVVSDALDLAGRLDLTLEPNCGSGASREVCGFLVGMRALLLDPSGAYDLVTVAAATGSHVQVDYETVLASSYADGQAVLMHAVASTYALGTDAATGVPQLTRYDGYASSRPAVDHVVGLAFEYLGDPAPPQARLGVAPDAPTRWRVTYGPPPPPVGVDDPATAWAEGENCAFAVVSGAHVPRLATLGPPGDLVPMSAAMLRDGPWCPDAASPRRFDADLLRVRLVRVRVRVEAATASMRGRVGTFFRRGGTSAPLVSALPDMEGVIDVALRNLRAGVP
jgi:hypothetical protein